ncbi:MAG: bifunctional UDP-N-acetylglucosamine diphosphorylase/glucosamine-1-phosphate N-acetyltransferase GlmU [Actinomycetota bacterium]
MGERKEKVTAIVLAAGGGTRMKSDLPKVLHRAAGRPLLLHVLAAVAPLEPARTIVVVSFRGDDIETVVTDGGLGDGVSYVLQDPPRGTGDATRVALEALSERSGRILIVPGDTPLIESATLDALLAVHEAAGTAAAILTARVTDPTGYGRIIRDDSGEVERIVEDEDTTFEEHAVDEVNAGAYVFDIEKLAQVIEKVDAENAQGEYYLTDVVALLRSEGERVAAYRTHQLEIQGVNSRAQLARAAGLLRRKVCERWMDLGVTIVDPSTTYIDASVDIDKDAVIHPFTFLEGKTAIGERAEIGPQVRVVDSSIGADATVTFAVVVGSNVGPRASVGPFASLRPGTRLEKGAKLGTFVEAKQTTVGEDSKANHLAYLGDAQIGKGVNVGAGTITCNWDGQEKHQTTIDDDAYIGSDTMLVAPVRIGKRAATGAGSVVKGDVPDDALAVGVPARIIRDRGDKMGRKKDEDDKSRDNRGD